jgi:hypothetical protein
MGDVVKGMFGKGYGTSGPGVGQVVDETGAEVLEQPSGGTGGRETGAMAVSPATVLRDLEVLLGDVRTAANRLINLPPPGVVPLDVKLALLGRYAELEAKVREAGDRIASGAAFDGDLGPVHQLQTEAVAFLEEVENTLRRVGVPGLVKQPSNRGQWVMYGLLAAGLGIAAVAGYKAYEHSKGPKGSSRPVKTRGRSVAAGSGGGAAVARSRRLRSQRAAAE